MIILTIILMFIVCALSLNIFLTNQTLKAVRRTARKEAINMATVKEALEILKAQVAETVGIDKSVLVYLAGIKQQLQDLIDNGATPEEIQALVDALDAQEKEMAAAIVANP